MHLSNQSLLVIIVVGIVAGWLAGRVMEGGGFGLIGDLIVGLIGAFIGDWLLPRLWHSPGHRYSRSDHQCVHWCRGTALDPASHRPQPRALESALVTGIRPSQSMAAVEEHPVDQKARQR